jgi:hypothetical protein
VTPVVEHSKTARGRRRCTRCRRRVDAKGRPTFKGGVGAPCEVCGGRRRKESSATRHLVRYEKGDPRAVEAGRRGAEAKYRRRAESQEAFFSSIAEKVITPDRADLILRTYFDVLTYEPGPSATAKDILDWRLFQVEVAEKILDRLEGLPQS